MIALPSRSGRTLARSSAASIRAMRLLEVVVGALQRLPSTGIAGGAVGAHQLVQPRQQLTGVGDVPADGGIGPGTGAVAVEPQMQEGQRGDVVDQRLRQPQRAQPLADQLRADHLVVVEADPAAVLEPPGRRLADVVQQRGQSQRQVRSVGLLCDGLVQHGQGVLVDVLVLVVLVPLQPQRGQFRQHPVGQPGVGQQGQTGPRIGAQDQLDQLGADPLRGDPVDLAGHRRHRRDHPRCGGEGQLRGETGSAQHPQRDRPGTTAPVSRACPAPARPAARGRRTDRRTRAPAATRPSR